MESIIERITRGHYWTFHGGVHPPEQKQLSSSKPIKQLPLPKELILPLQQHIGREGNLLVQVGDKVLKGQALTSSTNPMAVPIHASTSGIITAIKKSVIAHPSGLRELCVFIDVDGEDTWVEREKCVDISKLSQLSLITKIAEAGIAGMGGAGFPTHIKANNKTDIDFLIINGAECEPYITADDLLMQEQYKEIVSGIKILEKLLTPSFILIAIEDNKPRAIKALQQATSKLTHIKVCPLPTKYPTGGEKQLIKVLTGKEVKSGSLPIHAGIVMQNIATCFAINDAVHNGTPLLRRVVTVTGQALTQPQNVWALLGTPINFLLKECGAQPQEVTAKQNQQAVIMGGPMMGFSLSNDLVPIIKTSNCILVPSKEEMPSAFADKSAEVECIRCGQCADVCPSQLLPQELQWSAKAKDYPQLEKLNLSDCIDCGACAYVCPSQIPLVQYYRIAKAEIRNQQQLDLKADKAKIRFEARKLRLEKEKILREEKHKKAAAARKAAMNKNTPEATGAKSAVAAALARVKAKKAKDNVNNIAKDSSKDFANSSKTDNTAPSQETQVPVEKDQVKAAIARAKAKRLAKAQDKKQIDTIEPEPTLSKATKVHQEQDSGASENDKPQDDKKAKIATAIAKAKAKAKAKKLAQTQQDNNESFPEELPVPTTKETAKEDNTSTKDDKKAKIAAAIAKAKAKKLAQTQQDNNKSFPEELPVPTTKETAKEDNTSTKDDKKTKIAAAIAKAKAKKELKEQQNTLTNPENEST